MLIVREVEPHGTGNRLRLLPGDRILEVNGSPVRDEIDFQFYGAEEQVRLRVLREGRVVELAGRRRFGEPWGLVFEPMKYRSCGNRCIFCFVDQNPPGLRPSLYFKDEDYRLSFLHGNYVTLTNLSQADLRRIIEQRLSPLYVSVHATDPQVRASLLGLRRDDRLLAKLEALVEGYIELHAQIVVVPGYNDGAVLLRTLDDLWRLAPGVASVAVVPVGLTRHRKNLPPLRPVDSALAAELVRTLEPRAQEYRRRCGKYWVYLADELYLLAGLSVPAADRYDGFPQVENGVGLLRRFLDQFEAEKSDYPSQLPRPASVAILTGRLVAPVLRERVLPALQRVEGLQVELRQVRNRFFGDSVTVSGLLVGQDLAAEAHRLGQPPDVLLIPESTLNPDGLFLDDWTLPQLEQEVGTKVLAMAHSFLPLFERLAGGSASGRRRAKATQTPKREADSVAHGRPSDTDA
jgi:putative radical SAM enzyme (TIGR03279 family)